MSEVYASGRLHPSSILFRLVPHIRALLVPGLVVLFASKGGGWQVWLMLIIIPSTIYELGQYFTLRYQLGAEELVVRSGLFWKRDRRIPVERIQSVDLTQGPLHRLFKVADVRVETAGGNEPEAVLRVLSRHHVDDLRASINFVRGEAAPAPNPASGDTEVTGLPSQNIEQDERELVHISTTELVKLGLVSLRGAAAAGVIIALAWEFDLLDRLWPSYMRGMLESLDAWQLWILGGLVVLGLPIVLLAASILWSVLRLHDFRVAERGDNLRLSCGLFTKHHATVPRRRIQVVSVLSSPVHRLFDRVTVRVETAGGSAEQEQKKIIGQKWFVPLIPTDDLGAIVKEITGTLDIGELEWKPLSKGAFARMAKKEVISSLIFAAIAGLFWRPWGLLSIFVFLPLFLLHARADLRRTAYATFDGGIAYRSGYFSRRLTLTFDDRVQAVALDESPFDRRRDMATVDVDTAGAGAAGHRIRIRYLDRDVASTLFERLSKGAATTEPSL